MEKISFQSFEPMPFAATHAQSAQRLADLRKWLSEQNLAGYLLPHTDIHQSEYLAPCHERLAWLTGFTGSFGITAVLQDRAAVFSDGRYLTQMCMQIDSDLFSPLDYADIPLHEWLDKHLSDAAPIGFDPTLHSWKQIQELEKKIGAKRLRATNGNAIDMIWKDRPLLVSKPIVAQNPRYVSASSYQKRQKLAEGLRQKGVQSCLISALDSIAWLFNLRGQDCPHIPVFFAFAILRDDGSADLFIDQHQLTSAAKEVLGKNVCLHEISEFMDYLSLLKDSVVSLSPEQVPYAIATRLQELGATIHCSPDPCLEEKASKSPPEIMGAHEAHLTDGIAVCRFLHWFEEKNSQSISLDEIKLVRKLEKFRKASPYFKDISFPTIAGAGANGAIIHYRVTRDSNRQLNPGELLLVDSGGQYEAGTTDITRTLIYGRASKQQKRLYTLVLKSLIAISEARFPEGTTGRELDPFARRNLWQAGFDYAHGTGHGVGSYMSVHEGPQNISRKASAPFRAGMILSNEPGIYRPGEYGIRLENLLLVTEAKIPKGGNLPVHSFDTLTLAPFASQLIDRALLTTEEIEWLNSYHKRVKDKIGPHLQEVERIWLAQACQEI